MGAKAELSVSRRSPILRRVPPTPIIVDADTWKSRKILLISVFLPEVRHSLTLLFPSKLYDVSTEALSKSASHANIALHCWFPRDFDLYCRLCEHLFASLSVLLSDGQDKRSDHHKQLFMAVPHYDGAPLDSLHFTSARYSDCHDGLF
jgi:hypothetical protein